MISYVTANLHILLVYSLQLKNKLSEKKKDEKNILFILFIFCFVLFFSKAIPDISISDFEGNNEKLHNLLSDDKLTIISLCYLCVPCIKELDAINDVYEDWKEINFDFFAISVDDSRSQKRAKALANGKSWPYQIFFDKNQDFKRALGTSYIPQTFIIKNKEIVYQSSTGYQPGDENII